MKILLSWSSGKDSAWMLHRLRQQGHEPQGLLTTLNEAANRVSMHAVRAALLRAQASAAGVPLVEVPLPWPCTNDVYEQRMRAAVTTAVAAGFTHVAFGDLFLEDVRQYRETQLAGTGLQPLFPLWLEDTRLLAHEMLGAGLKARITCIDPRVLDRRFAGREFDAAFLDELPASVDPCGERGEFHSFAYAGPMFSHEVTVETGETVDRDAFVFTDLRLAE